MTRREAVYQIIREYLMAHSGELAKTDADWAIDMSGEIEDMLVEVEERMESFGQGADVDDDEELVLT